MQGISELRLLEASEEIKKKYVEYFTSTFVKNKPDTKEKLNEFILKSICQDTYISLSKNYKKGATLKSIDGLSAELSKVFSFPLYSHQEKGIKSILNNKNTIISTGTGSGKTEIYLIPIYNYCMKDKGAGVKAILIYPMKALARDQKRRIDNNLADLQENGITITCKVIDGDTKTGREETIANPPDILITNYSMLDRMMLDPKYNGLFSTSLKFVVIDEIHYYRGIQAIDVSCLIKRLKSRLKENPLLFVGTSATITSKPNNEAIEEIKTFYADFFGGEFESKSIILPVEEDEVSDSSITEKFRDLRKQDTIEQIMQKFEVTGNNPIALGEKLLSDELFHLLINLLKKPLSFKKIVEKVSGELDLDKKTTESLVPAYFDAIVYSKSPKTERHLAKIQIHNFVTILGEGVFQCLNCKKFHLTEVEACDCGSKAVIQMAACRNCGEIYYFFPILENKKPPALTKVSPLVDFQNEEYEKSDYRKFEEFNGFVLHIENNMDDSLEMNLCLTCGCLSKGPCKEHPDNSLKVYDGVSYSAGRYAPNFKYCPSCKHRASKQRKELIHDLNLSIFDAASVFFDELYYSLPEDNRKMLIFADNIKGVSRFAWELERNHNTNVTKKLILKSLANSENKQTVEDIYEMFELEMNSINLDENTMNFDELDFFKELLMGAKKFLALERNGLIRFDYKHLDRIVESVVENLSFGSEINKKGMKSLVRKILDTLRREGAVKIPGGKGLGYKNNPVVFVFRKSDDLQRGLNVRSLPFYGKPKKAIKDYFSEKINEEKFRKIYEEIIFQLTSKKILSKSVGERFYQINMKNILVFAPEKVYVCEECDLPSFANKCSFCGSIHLKEYSFEDYSKYLSKDYIANSALNFDNLLKLKTGVSHSHLNSDKRIELEQNFKKAERKENQIDVMVSTCTLEMGIDIGDLISVGLIKSPPSAASYKQRVGRAGRKQNYSLVSSVMGTDPIDKYYFDNLPELIDGEIVLPKIEYNNQYLVDKHLNSILLNAFLFSTKEDYLKKSVKELVLDKHLVLNEIGAFFSKRGAELESKLTGFLGHFNLQLLNIDLSNIFKCFQKNLEGSILKLESKINSLKVERQKISQELEKTRDRMVLRELREKEKNLGTKIQEYEDIRFIEAFKEFELIPTYGFSKKAVVVYDKFFNKKFTVSPNSMISSYFPTSTFLYLKKKKKVVSVKASHEQEFYYCNSCGAYVNKKSYKECPICASTEKKSDLFFLPEFICIEDTKDPFEFVMSRNDRFVNIDKSKIFGKQEFKGIKISKYSDLSVTVLGLGLKFKTVKYCAGCNKCFSTEKHSCGSPQIKDLRLYDNFYTRGIELDFSSYELTGEQLFTLKNGLLNATNILFGFEQTELDVVLANNGKIFLFDNFEGGTGYSYSVVKNLGMVLKKLNELINNPEDECKKGCLKCVYSYWRKQDIKYIDKNSIKELLSKLLG